MNESIVTDNRKFKDNHKYFDFSKQTLLDKKNELLGDLERILNSAGIELRANEKTHYMEFDWNEVEKIPDITEPLVILIDQILECDSVMNLLGDYQKVMGDFI